MELRKFLNGTNLIKIPFNKNKLKELIVDPSYVDMLFGKWLFVEYTKDSSKIISPNPDTLTLNFMPFDIDAFAKVLWQSFTKWQEECPLIPFPDIILTNDNKSSAVSIDGNYEHHIVFLNLDDLSSISKFKYVLGHELGHIFYSTVYKRDFETQTGSQNQIEYNTIYKKLFPVEAFAIVVIQALIVSYSFFTEVHGFFTVLALLVSALLLPGLYLFSSLASRKDRINNFRSEYFSDYFAFHFMGAQPIDIIFKEYGQGNGYTHPSSNYRKSYLKQFVRKDLDQWENPMIKNGKRYRMLNILEVFHFYESVLPKKIKKFLNHLISRKG